MDTYATSYVRWPGYTGSVLQFSPMPFLCQQDYFWCLGWVAGIFIYWKAPQGSSIPTLRSLHSNIPSLSPTW